MKITMDLPDNTVIMFASIVVNEEEAYYAKSTTFNKELFDGNTITITLNKEELPDD